MPVLLAAALFALPHLHIDTPFRAFRPGPPGAERQDRTTVRTPLSGGYRLALVRDDFRKTVTCRLDAADVRYAGGVVTFSFGRRTDTANALFRIDDGPLRAAGELGPEAAGLGAPFYSSNISNPSDGRVRLPYRVLQGARAIAIRANDHRAHRTFPLVPLQAALAEARARGCDDLA